MLNKIQLQISIESAIKDAMKEAFKAAIEVGNRATSDNVISVDQVASEFADKAKGCASDIANAIDTYIKSAQITLNLGTMITPLPTGLVSPTGPVTGVITLATPTTLLNAIS